MKLILWIVLPCLIIGATGCETSYNGPATDNYRHIPPAFWDNSGFEKVGGASANDPRSETLTADQYYASQH